MHCETVRVLRAAGGLRHNGDSLSLPFAFYLSHSAVLSVRFFIKRVFNGTLIVNNNILCLFYFYYISNSYV